MLNLNNAIRLYVLLENHIPNEKGLLVLDFVDKIIKSMIRKGEHKNYTEAILIMHKGMTLEKLSKMPPEQHVELFTSGLVENQIMKLHGFIRGIS